MEEIDAVEAIVMLNKQIKQLKADLAEKGEYGYSQQVVDALTKERDKLQAENAHRKLLVKDIRDINGQLQAETNKLLTHNAVLAKDALNFQAENEKLKETNQRLNRRCQIAESANKITIEECKRQGVGLGRLLANAGYVKLEADLAKVQATSVTFELKANDLQNKVDERGELNKCPWLSFPDNPPEKGQTILLYWPNPREIACFTCTGKDEYKFHWGSSRFGHPGEDLATLWMPLPLP